MAFVPHVPVRPARSASPTPLRSRVPKCSLTAPPVAAAAAKGPALLAPSHRHFLHVDDFTTQQLLAVLQSAKALKDADALNDPSFAPLAGKAMSMLFAKPSARTRVSFETAMYKAGGHALCLGPEVGVNSREAAKDVARVLASMTDLVMARLFAHQDIVDLAHHSSVPVINGLTDYNHPCQIVADALTVMEHRGAIEGAKIVYVGDGNNIVHSWFELAARLDIHFICCCPESYLPDMQLMARAKDAGASDLSISHDPNEAVIAADFVYSDVWASMGKKEETEQRLKIFQPFQITHSLMQRTPNAKFMHCLPAERGRECTDQVMEADYSVVFQQAENRMHAQLAIMLMCMGIDV